MPVLRVCEGEKYTVEVSKTGMVSFNFWDEKDNPLLLSECEFSKREWLNIIHSTVDLMDEDNFKEALKENLELVRSDADEKEV